MSSGKKHPLHPLCLLFPIMPEEELIGLAEDIRRRGLLEPIMLLDGQVLDGRHRLEACRRAGVKPRFVHWKGDDSPLEWIVAKNMRRRQFNAGQRAVLALEVLPMLEKEARQRQRAGKKLTWNKQIAALDNGEEIPFPIAGRPCLVRVNPNPTTMEAATARGDLILPE